MPAPAPRPAAFVAALLVVYLVWGSTYLAMKYVVAGLPPFLAASARHLTGGLLLYAWLRARGARAPTRAQWGGSAIVGGFLLLGGNGGVMWAEQFVDSSLAAIMIATVPLWVALMEPLAFGGRRPRPLHVVALVVGFAGVAVLVGRPERWGGSWGTGVLVLLLAAFLWALGSLLSRRVARPESALLGASMQMVTGGAIIALFGTLVGEWPRVHLDTVPLTSWIGLVYLALFGSVLAYTCYVWLLQNGSASTATTYAYVNPIIAIVLGFVVAGEVLTLRTLVASAVILASVAILVTWRARPATAPAVPQATEEPT